MRCNLRLHVFAFDLRWRKGKIADIKERENKKNVPKYFKRQDLDMKYSNNVQNSTVTRLNICNLKYTKALKGHGDFQKKVISN